MDYLEVGVRAFTYVLIFSLVEFLVPKLLGTVEYKKDEVGKTCFTKKKISYIFFGAAVFFTIIFSIMKVFGTGIKREAEIYLSIGLICFCLLWYILCLMFRLWFLSLEADQLVYRNYLGKKTILKTEDIAHFERKPDGSISIFSRNHSAISLEEEYVTAVLLWIAERNIKLDAGEKKEQFVIRPAKYHRILSIACLVIFVAFFVFGVAVRSNIATIVFGILTIFGVWNCCNHYLTKYCLDEGKITYYGLFNRKVTISCSEILKAETQQSDNTTYLLFYTKESNKPALKVNLYYENAYLLKQFAANKKWM